MSAISQYSSAPAPITGQFGYTYKDTAVLNATLPIATAEYTDVSTLTVQEGNYLIEFSISLTALATTTLADLAVYISTAPDGLAIIAIASEVSFGIVIASDRELFYRISKYVNIEAPNTEIYCGVLASVGVIGVSVDNVLLNMSRLSP